MEENTKTTPPVKVLNAFTPPPGMMYKVCVADGHVYYLGSCPEGKAQAFCKAKKGISLEVWKAKGWLCIEPRKPEKQRKQVYIMFKNLIKSLLRLIDPCQVKEIVVEYCREYVESTPTPIDNMALQAVDVVLDTVLGCNGAGSRKA